MTQSFPAEMYAQLDALLAASADPRTPAAVRQQHQAQLDSLRSQNGAILARP